MVLKNVQLLKKVIYLFIKERLDFMEALHRNSFAITSWSHGVTVRAVYLYNQYHLLKSQ